MNRLPYSRLFAVTSLFSVVALAGCGLGSSSFGVIGDPAGAPESSPPIMGSVFGGHAPLVGARVYVLTPSRTANYGLVTSLMRTSLSTTAGASPVSPDVSGTGSATNGMYYVTTDANGGFNLTGDYTCTSGYPVYIAAAGGSPSNVLTPGNTYSVTSATVNSVSTTTPVTENITLTTTAPANVYKVGEQVIFRGATGTLVGIDGVSAVVQGVTTSGTPATTKLTFTAANVGGGAGTTYPFSAPYPTAVGISTNNTAVVNMAALGTCPSSGNFSTTGTGTYSTGDTGQIPFIYMNEVSTTAAAYALAGFGKDAFHIGANTGGTNATYVANSLNQAIFNAFLLYDITGSSPGNVNNTPQGEGHLARSLTPEGNGIIPQMTLDSLGNILAACVDSGNTATSTTAQCNVLESTATSDGTTTGTHAPDTATAIFNIAHYPAGVGNANFARTLYGIPTGVVPFSPALTAAPNEFSITIAFGAPATSPASGGSGSIIDGPQVLSIDAAEPEGIWIGNYYTQPVKIFQSGTPDYATNTAMAGFYHNQRAVTVDPSNNVWMTFADINTVFKISNTGAVGPSFTGTGTDALNYPIGASFRYNSLANQYDLLVSNLSAGYLVELSPTLANIPPPAGSSAKPFSSAACLASQNATNAVDPNGFIYSLQDNGNAGGATLCVIDGATGLQDFVTTGFSTHVGPNYFAIGPALNNPVGGWAAWATDSNNNALREYAISGANSTFATLTGGGMNLPCSTAVDSAGTVWVGNGGNTSLSAFAYNSTTNGYYALSPATGIAQQGGYTNCGNPAIDRAGDVWTAYQGTADPTLATVYETIGIASPTMTPISTATKNGTLGTRPY